MELRRIAVLTSGGDAPGMNAAVRAVVRGGVDRGWEVVGVRHGYGGLIAGDFTPLDARAVGGIVQLGGTVLGSSRCPEFREPEPRRRALDRLAERGVSGLVVIGGDGSQRGAHALSQMGLPVIGVASTIDNDLYGSEITIGVDTALNVALEAIDRLKVTASSHLRAFLVEVMGRHCGYLALMAGIAGGAEAVLIPERETPPEELATLIRAAYVRGKRHAVVVVAEGCTRNAFQLERHFAEHRDRLGLELRVTVLGHMQRGGAPGAFDRLPVDYQGAAVARQWQGLTALSAAGGVVLFLSSLCFLTVVIATAFWGRRIEPPPIELAVPLEPAATTRSVWDRFGLWTAAAVVLIAIAYAWPIYHLYAMHRFGSVGYQPF